MISYFFDIQLLWSLLNTCVFLCLITASPRVYSPAGHPNFWLNRWYWTRNSVFREKCPKEQITKGSATKISYNILPLLNAFLYRLFKNTLLISKKVICSQDLCDYVCIVYWFKSGHPVMLMQVINHNDIMDSCKFTIPSKTQSTISN